jgi:hypothetical protein
VPIDTADTQETADTGQPQDTAPPEDTEPVPLELCINEFMSDNQSVLINDDGSTPDWVELHNPGETDIHLAGWSLTDDPDEYDKHAIHSSLWINAGEFLLFYADDQVDDGPEHLSFRLGSEGGAVGLYAPDRRGQVVHYGVVQADFSVYRVQDCCSGEGCLDFDFRGTPGTTNDPPIPVEETLLPLGDSWKYWDLLEEPPSDWKTLTFDDSVWTVGTAPLGDGDTHIATTIYIGPEGDRRPTTYFRHTFEVADLSLIQSMILELVVDDGALIWLNETEVVRSNVAEGNVSHYTWASSAIGSSDEYSPVGWPVDLAYVSEGTNILAVEVHQHASTSSDLTFDLGVVVEVLDTE